MDFPALIDAIYRMWSLLWPAVVVTVIGCGVVYVLDPERTRMVWSRLREATDVLGSRVDSVRRVLEPYGMSQAIPVAFFVLATVYVLLINGPVMGIATSMPPTVTYMPVNFVDSHLNDKERLILHKRFPTSEDIHDAYGMAKRQAEIEKLLKDSSRASLEHRVLVILKLFSIATLIAWMILLKGSGRKLALTARAEALLVLFSVT